MNQKSSRMRNKSYILFITFLILYGAVAPVLYTLVFLYLESYYFTLDLVSPEVFLQGDWFTLCATLLMVQAAYLCRPTPAYKMDFNRYKSIYLKYCHILFYLAVISIGTGILLDLIYGKLAINLTAQRPPIAVYMGYFAAGFGQSIGLVIFFPLLLYKKFDKFSTIVIFLMLIQSITAQSRSGIFNICYFILVGLAFSRSANQIQISRKKIAVLAMAGVAAIVLADVGRGAQPFEVFFQALQRFYENNQALYMAVENPQKIYEILTEGQPRVLLQQMFSFAFERTEYPSSFRLLEYWGGTIAPDERGHIAGYAYGWLGLCFGLFRWYGLIAIYLFFLSLFSLLRATSRNPTLVNLVFFSCFSGILFEFFQNLGMDSFLEKAFKGLVYAIFYIVVIKVLATVTSRPAIAVTGESHRQPS